MDQIIEKALYSYLIKIKQNALNFPMNKSDHQGFASDTLWLVLFWNLTG